MQCRDTTYVRLQLAQLVGTDDPNAGNPVGDRPRLDVVQPCTFGVVEGDKNLAAGDPADTAFRAELFQEADTPAAEQRLVRTGLVVQAGVHDAAVASGLVRREPVLLFEERHVGIGPTPQDLARDCDADDTATDYSDSVG